MTKSTNAPFGASGTVKWFNKEKGYGYLIQGGAQPELYISRKTVEAFGLATIKTGDHLTGMAKRSGKETFEMFQILDYISAPEPKKIFKNIQERVRLRSYSPNKKYGFLNRAGGGKNFFVHASSFLECGIDPAFLEDGEPFLVTKIDCTEAEKPAAVELKRISA